MTVLATLCMVAVLAWVALVVAAQLLTPGQSPLGMGMSGLARGPHPWIMRAAFVVRGTAALLLVAAIPLTVPEGARSLVGLALLWVWGLGSALLSVYATDMPGEEPTAAGKAHTLIALVASSCAVVGMILVSVALNGDPTTEGAARWALPIAITTTLALVFAFAGFAAAARDAAAGREARVGRDLAEHVGGVAPAAESASPAATPVPLTLTVAPPAASGSRPVLGGLGDISGLLERIFLGLVMFWTVLVAAGI